METLIHVSHGKTAHTNIEIDNFYSVQLDHATEVKCYKDLCIIVDSCFTIAVLFSILIHFILIELLQYNCCFPCAYDSFCNPQCMYKVYSSLSLSLPLSLPLSLSPSLSLPLSLSLSPSLSLPLSLSPPLSLPLSLSLSLSLSPPLSLPLSLSLSLCLCVTILLILRRYKQLIFMPACFPVKSCVH